ncbi:hypothetical protein HanIR_Chr06g0265731 [Helianthus annuus]|nr:hypothetical protein HanIR_Chr06g0265731 [Helianthus annuus]
METRVIRPLFPTLGTLYPRVLVDKLDTCCVHASYRWSKLCVRCDTAQHHKQSDFTDRLSFIYTQLHVLDIGTSLSESSELTYNFKTDTEEAKYQDIYT